MVADLLTALAPCLSSSSGLRDHPAPSGFDYHTIQLFSFSFDCRKHQAFLSLLSCPACPTDLIPPSSFAVDCHFHTLSTLDPLKLVTLALVKKKLSQILRKQQFSWASTKWRLSWGTLKWKKRNYLINVVYTFYACFYHRMICGCYINGSHIRDSINLYQQYVGYCSTDIM